jgi:predicted aspartyl protease
MSVAFEPKQGPILIAGEITGPTRSTTVRLIVDTGATTSLINLRVLTTLGFDSVASAFPAGHIEIVTGSAVERVAKVVLTRLTALGQHRFGFPVVAHDLPVNAPVDGLLGLDFFRNQILTVDFQKGQITLA